MISNWNEAEFVEISKICGFDISTEDIEALAKRKLLSAWTGEVFGRAHLYLLATYFDAITVLRHPWSVRNSELTLQDVKRLNNEVAQLDPQKDVDEAVRQTFQATVESFFLEINPFGPLDSMITLLNADALSEFKNKGRLAYELQLFVNQTEFADSSEGTDSPPPGTARPTSVTTILDSVKREPEVETPAPEVVIDSDTRDTEEGTAILPTNPEIDVDASEVQALLVGGPDGIDGDKTIPVSGAFHSGADESAEMVLTELAEESLPEVTTAPELISPEASLGLEESSMDLVKEEPEVQNPFVPTEKTQALIKRLNTKSENQTDIAEQIQALNVQRQTLISNQDWQGMADLYEDKIDLFDGLAERQEVLLTLATLHELKIKNPRRAATFFQLAIENGTQTGLQKAYEGIQRVGYRPDLKAFCSSWLQERLNKEISEVEMPFLQLTNSNFLRECGKAHHAFLSYAAFLTRDPEKNVSETSLKNLESFAVKIEDSELESFYTDILDFENES